MRALAGLALSAVIFGCSVTRPDQDNFEIDATNGAVEPFVRSLSTKFNATIDQTAATVGDNDPGQMFTVKGSDATVVVISLPDDRCNPNAPMHATYKQGRYRADLVYETAAQSVRTQAKQKLIDSATAAGLTVKPFKEC